MPDTGSGVLHNRLLAGGSLHWLFRIAHDPVSALARKLGPDSDDNRSA
ncbi:hypothetical protein [Nocardia bhagyanarayanae]|nr:hypothetical protein [Nocardia bhagyanarayanae]